MAGRGRLVGVIEAVCLEGRLVGREKGREVKGEYMTEEQGFYVWRRGDGWREWDVALLVCLSRHSCDKTS